MRAVVSLFLALCAPATCTTIYVVGNGEMTMEQEGDILVPGRVGILWGFNDLKGIPVGVTPDVLVTRWHHGQYPTPSDKMAANHSRMIQIEGPCTPPRWACIRRENLTLFPDCHQISAEALRHVRDNPSSGIIALGLLQQDTNVTLVNVYAMNFQFRYGFAHSFHEKDVAMRCCTKCRFHPTYSTFYFPIRHADCKWLLQFMGMYLIPLVIGGSVWIALVGVCVCACTTRRDKRPDTTAPNDPQDPCGTPLLKSSGFRGAGSQSEDVAAGATAEESPTS